MNIYDPYPNEVEIDGKTVRLNLAYDHVLRVMDIQEMDELTPSDKLCAQCAWLLADGEALPTSAQKQAEIIKAAFALIPKAEKESGERYLDFHQDAALIRSAFFRIGVDLLRDPIHFCQFLELLADLPRDTALMRTVEIRRRPVPKPNGHNQQEIAELMKAKAKVAIKMSEDERRALFAESLKNSTVLRG